jgi:AcrR family transcriptional regulator
MADDDSVASAARALADATAALTRLLGQQMGAVSEDVGRAVSHGLREASRGLETASDSISGVHTAAERRREKVEDTRRDLLDAAARLVAERGYEGASVGDVASEAGYTKGAVYSNFGSKEDLFRVLAKRELEAGRVVPAPGATPPSSQQALLNLEIVAAMSRSLALRRALGPAFEDALQAAAGATPGQGAPREALDQAVARLAITIIGPMVEEADPAAAGVTSRLSPAVQDGPPVQD